MGARVVVIGDALLDVTVAPAEPMRHGGDVPGTVSLRPGGQAANVAVRLARRGIETRLVCALGDDVSGRHVRHALEAEHIALDGLTADGTGAVAILVDGRGERSMVSQRRGLVPALAGVDVTRLVGGAGWLVVSGYVLLEPGAAELAERLAGAPMRRVALGCSVRTEVAGWLGALRALGPDLVILNGDEARAVAGVRESAAISPAQPPGLAAGAAESVGSGAIVTEPGRASAAVGAVRVEVEREGPKERAADATGAGDAFAAAIVARLDPHRWPPAEDALRAALEAGLHAAAEVVAVPGAQGVTPGERAAAGT